MKSPRKPRRKINGALLAAGLVDEIVLYVAARVFGDTGLDMLVSPSPSSPADARHFELHDVSRLPADNLKIVLPSASRPVGNTQIH